MAASSVAEAYKNMLNAASGDLPPSQKSRVVDPTSVKIEALVIKPGDGGGVQGTGPGARCSCEVLVVEIPESVRSNSSIKVTEEAVVDGKKRIQAVTAKARVGRKAKKGSAEQTRYADVELRVGAQIRVSLIVWGVSPESLLASFLQVDQTYDLLVAMSFYQDKNGENVLSFDIQTTTPDGVVPVWEPTGATALSSYEKLVAMCSSVYAYIPSASVAARSALVVPLHTTGSVLCDGEGEKRAIVASTLGRIEYVGTASEPKPAGVAAIDVSVGTLVKAGTRDPATGEKTDDMWDWSNVCISASCFGRYVEAFKPAIPLPGGLVPPPIGRNLRGLLVCAVDPNLPATPDAVVLARERHCPVVSVAREHAYLVVDRRDTLRALAADPLFNLNSLFGVKFLPSPDADPFARQHGNLPEFFSLFRAPTTGFQVLDPPADLLTYYDIVSTSGLEYVKANKGFTRDDNACPFLFCVLKAEHDSLSKSAALAGRRAPVSVIARKRKAGDDVPAPEEAPATEEAPAKKPKKVKSEAQ